MSYISCNVGKDDKTLVKPIKVLIFNKIHGTMALKTIMYKMHGVMASAYLGSEYHIFTIRSRC